MNRPRRWRPNKTRRAETSGCARVALVLLMFKLILDKNRAMAEARAVFLMCSAQTMNH
ncbi:hypothetical protein SCH4B_0415 [Ruegeria sp. TrichCH4B]|nr:hypothetical protein SCH4B_0415 [Ruegeria sp. TrichCH4B]